MQNNVREYLGLSEQDSQATLSQVYCDAFTAKLAEFNIEIGNNEQLSQALAMATKLRQLNGGATTGSSKTASLLNRGMDLMQARLQRAVDGSPTAKQAMLLSEVSDKVAAYMQDPAIFAHGLSTVCDNH